MSELINNLAAAIQTKLRINPGNAIVRCLAQAGGAGVALREMGKETRNGDGVTAGSGVEETWPAAWRGIVKR